MTNYQYFTTYYNMKISKALTLLLFVGLAFGACEEDKAIEDGFEAILSVETTTISVKEGDVAEVSFDFSIDKKNSSGSAISLNYSIEGTASSGSDYQVLSGVAVIEEESSTVNVQVQLIDDVELEGEETIVLTLSSTELIEGLTLSNDKVVTITISDNDQRVVSIASTDATALEGSDNGEFTVSINDILSHNIAIDYTIAGTAQNGSDYTTLTGGIEILAGNTSAIILIDVADDAEVESDETVILALSSTQLPGVDVAAANEATVTISDNDEMSFSASVTVQASDNTALEGDNDGAFTIEFDQTNNSGSAISIPYTISGTATSDVDFSPLSGTATIADGSNSVTVDVTVINDEDVESDETVILTLDASQPSGITLGNTTSATVTISDNDSASAAYVATISTSASSVGEAEAGTGFKVVLDKTNESGADINVLYQLSGTATEGVDYTAPSGTAIIANGSIEAVINMPLIDDSDDEGDETIVITLASTGHTEGVTVGTSSTITITITDDDAAESCANDNSIDQNNWTCDETPATANSYAESITGDVRTIVTNGVPDHDYRNQIPQIIASINTTTKTYTVDVTPNLANSVSDLTNGGSPVWKFGVATNGVPIDPAPGQPFIFENTTTGEYNWDWVMEPNNNMEAVGLDCSVSHFQPDGQLHYHGNMALYADQLLSGLGSGSTTPSDPIQIGWASDGFPIVYEYGPNTSGVLSHMQSSYQLKSGERSGDGISEPCGEYNGKYTNDYEFVNGLGDLDECNGIAQSITIGGETFSYFYVITDSFPYISRCISGTPDHSFSVGG